MFRNKEFRRFCVCFFLMASLIGILGFLVSREAGLLSLFSSIAFGVAFYVFTKNRYKSIARISEEIDLVLHDELELYISNVEEGELSILQSEIMKMTSRIRETNAALKKEKERLADSLADVAHQLRTPLTSVSLILSLLENCSDEEERRSLLKETEELLVRMDWLLTALLKLSRLDAGIVLFQKKPVEVRRLIEKAVHPLLIPMELHDIILQMNVPAGIEILGDFGWLSEAIQNILKNCMESVGDGGKITVQCEDTLLFSEIRIHDSGKGFEKEDLPHLFDRFYRGNHAGASGYGIGLALCKMIILRQNGTITAKNHPQGGAVFKIRFPK